MAKTKAEKIESLQEEIKQLENQRKRLLQEQKAQERKDRTRRLCKRAGLLESMLPGTIPLTDEQFKAFLEKTILSESASKLLSTLTAQIAATPTPQGTGQVGSMSVEVHSNHAKPQQSSGNMEGGDEADGATVED